MSMAAILARLGPSPPRVQPLGGDPSAYVSPQRVLYTLDGAERRWDKVASHPSVACVLYHEGLKSVLLVRQFRPAVYAFLLSEAAARGDAAPPPLSVGFTFELCAGLVDKQGKTLAQIMQEEILEEVGYDVPLERIRMLASYHAAIGLNGSRQTMFVATVDDSMRAEQGGGGLRHDGEAIEVVSLDISQIDAFIADGSLATSAGLMAGLLMVRLQIEAGTLQT